eukprot:TRINITY_DN9996_c0_g1_i1.p1 TRINITY_DN9996_c0_g1~~TRINITY_DN9996_c0_g1_i1.p1  ORF type:complete len:848 (-),score=210.14 TRINITY_DN9996_c0_g1_i1:25-2568(-)
MDVRYWFDQVPFNPDEGQETVKDEVIHSRKERGKFLFENESEKNSRLMKDSGSTWIGTVMKSGTSSDRTAAMTIAFQQSYFRFNILDTLIAMARKKGRRESQMAADSLKDLFIHCLLPPNRGLRYFKDQPLNKDKISDKELLYWYFEEQIKVRYNHFLKILEVGSHDTLAHYKEFVIKTVTELLKERPQEQQTKLIGVLVNKFGDPDNKISSKVIFHLSNLVEKKHTLQLPIVREIELYISRPNIARAAQYYALLFANTLRLSKKNVELANRITLLYFSILKNLESDNEFYGKVVRTVITGITRAFPYFSLPYQVFEENLDTFYKLIVVASFNKSTEAQLLLFKVFSSQSEELPERFYRSLYAKLLNPSIYQSSKLGMFLHVLYKALETDRSINRVMAFTKRLLQVSLSHKAGFCCAALMLVSELLKAMPSMTTIFIERPEVKFVSAPNGKKKKKQITPNKQKEEDGEKPSYYDPKFKRPQDSRAETTCLWELTELARHYHPTVANFAKSLLQGKPIVFENNPLVEYSFIAFLDRFSFKTPKKNIRGSKLKKTARALREQPVTSAEFRAKKEEDVADTEQFLLKYFQNQSQGFGLLNHRRKGKLDKKKKKSKDIDEDDIALDGEEDALEESDAEDDLEEEDINSEDEEADDEDEEKDEDEDEDEDEDDEGDFSYDDLDEKDFDEDAEDRSTKAHLSEKDLEKMLLDNLSSEDESPPEDNEEGSVPNKKNKKKVLQRTRKAISPTLGSRSAFASADDFEETLSRSVNDTANEKQLAWEEETYNRHRNSRTKGKDTASGGANREKSKTKGKAPPHAKRGGRAGSQQPGKRKRNESNQAQPNKANKKFRK